MRKLLFSLFTLFSCTIMAQVTLQHTFVGRGHYYATYDYSSMSSLIYQENMTEYYGNAYYLTSFDTTTYTITQYNTDYSVRSTRVFNIPVVPGYVAISCSLSKAIFDDDANTVELLVKYEIADYYSIEYTNRNLRYKMLAYREDGTMVADFGYSSYIYVYPYLHVYDREYRIWVEKQDYIIPAYNRDDPQRYDETYSFEVYKVNKRNASGLQQVPARDLPRKVMHDGKVFIIAGDRVIDVLGRDVR